MAKTNGGGDLRTRRLAAGLTRQQLAERAGCSMSTVGLLEGGWTPRHSDVLARLDAVLASTPERKGVNPN
jgi:transcriptional regulator with XRE-family HTH domain